MKQRISKIMALTMCLLVTCVYSVPAFATTKDHEHHFNTWGIQNDGDKAATCTEAGQESRNCTDNDCGYVETRTVPALGHAWGSWVSDVDPTCTETGLDVRTCTRDDSHKDSKVVPALGHDWGDWEVKTKATCEANGSKHRVCKRNSAHTEDETIPMTGHNWNAGEVTTPATCTTEGVRTYTCQNEGCDKTYTEAIPMIAHEWKADYEVDNEPTCTNPGQKSIHCKNCNTKKADSITVIPALGHNYDKNGDGTVDLNDAANTTPATCAKEGSYDVKCQRSNCDWYVPNYGVIAALGHDYDTNGDGKVTAEDATATTPATCTTAGERTYTCKRDDCPDNEADAANHTIREVIPATGHTEAEDYTIDRYATCTTDGSKSKHCTVCKDKIDGTEVVIPATGHNFTGIPVSYKAEPENHKDAHKLYTCENIDLNTMTPCTETKDVVDHAWGSHPATVVEPTCVEKGQLRYTCEICNDTKTEDVDPLGHNYDANGDGDVTLEDAVKLYPASCTTPGYYVVECQTEGCTEDTKYHTQTIVIDPVGHNWEHYKKAAGNLVNGTEYDYCTACGVKQNVKTLYGYNKVTTKLTKVKKGKKSFTAKWAKVSKANLKKLSGYQIRYSKKSSMSGAKTVSVSKNAVSKKITKLSKNKKYYVQVRTYAKVGGKTMYSSWSAKKAVKTK